MSNILVKLGEITTVCDDYGLPLLNKLDSAKKNAWCAIEYLDRYLVAHYGIVTTNIKQEHFSEK